MRIALLSLLLTTAALTGCGVPKPIEGRNDPYDRQQVMFTDEKLKKQTAVGQATVTRDPSGLLFITVPIRNTYKKKIDIQYRVTWFNETGQVINQGAWISKQLQPNVPDQIMANSTTYTADEFQVDVKWNSSVEKN
jgi:uncharacterized protein YcfL